MADDAEEMGKQSNGPPIEIEVSSTDVGEETLPSLLRRFLTGIGASCYRLPPPTLLQRIRVSFIDNAPRLKDASRNSARHVLQWTRRGSPLRALLVISVGTITLLALTGFLVFMLFFLAATLNAVIISFLVSLAAAGGFLAIFFACTTAIYIGALSVACFAITATTISLIIAVSITTGWLGFFWIIWLAAMKSMNLTKRSLNVTGSAVSAYYATRQAQRSESFDSAMK